MATLTNRKVSQTYKDLLQVSNSNSGIDSTLRGVEDGEGTSSILQLSTAAVNITGAGTLQYAGTAITSTAAELNVLDGYTGSVTELNYLDTLHATGVTATEFDYLDGVTSNIQTQLDAKVEATLTTEQVQDVAGPLVATGGTKTLITVTYDDDNNNMDFVVDNDLSNYSNSSSGFLTAHPNISAASSSDNSGRTYIQDITLDSNGHVTAIATATESVTDTNTFRTVEVDTNGDDSANNTLGSSETLRFKKGSNITLSESGGIVTIASTDTNTQLSNAQVRTAVEAASDSNVFTDDDHSKLNAIEASADVTDTDNVRAADALMDDEVDADLKTFALPANTTISTFGKSIVDDANATAVRTTIGVDPAGTDNSTNVTLAGSLDYITLSGQEITRNAVDLAADVTGTLPVGNGGTGATSLNNLITLSTHTTGNYVATISGTSNEIEVSGSGSEGATVTIGLPDDITIAGDLTVNGDTTTLDVTNLKVTDNLIELNQGVSSNANDSGIIIERGSTGNNAIIMWDESADKFKVGTTTATADSTGNLTVATGTLVAALEGNASTATALATARDFGFTGDVTGTTASGFDGTGDISVALTIASTAVESGMLNNNVISGQTNMTGDVADADELMISDGGTLKRIDFSVFRDAIFNDVSGDATVASGGALTIAANSVALGTDTTGNYLATLADSGTGGITVANSGSESAAVTVELDVNGLTAATLASGDFLAFSDESASGDPTKKESIDDVATLFAGAGLTASSAVINLDIQGTSLGSEIVTGDLVLYADISDSNTVKSMDVGSIVALAPQGDITGVTAGTNLSGGGNGPGAVTLNVDDAFLVNDANDTTSGTITAAGFTTAGSLTLGGHAVNDIDITSESTDADDHLMTALAIKNRILDFGYTTNVGDITAVTAGAGLSGGGNSSGVTLNVDIQGTSLAGEVATNDLVLIADTSDSNTVKSMDVGSIIALAPQGDITAVTAGTGLTGGGTADAVTLNVAAGNLIDVQANQVDVDLSELSTSTSDGDGDFFAVIDSSNAQKKLTKGNINLSGFNNDSGFTTNTGDITGVTAGNGLSGGGTSSGVTLNLDIDGQSLLNEAPADADTFIIYDDSASAFKKVAASDVLGSAGDITSVTAGTNISGGGSSGDVTLNVDDAFLINSGNDTTSGTITAAGFTTAGSITLGGHAFNDIDLAGEFVDADDHLMSSAAINDRITSFGYTTNTGDITAVVAGSGLSGGSNSGSATVNVDIQGTSLASGVATNDLVLIADTSDSNAIKSMDINSIIALAPQGDITAVVAGTNLSGGGTSSSVTLNVDDAFLKNDANDTTSGTITAAGFTTSGSITLGGHSFNDIDIGSEFVDTDDHLMSSGAIKEKIEAFGYTTNTGDITAVVAGTGLSGGNTSGSATLNVDIDGLGLAPAGATDDTVAIYDESASAIKKLPLSDIVSLAPQGDILGVTAGTNCSGGGTSGTVTINVDDAFLKNNADDTTSGTITAGGFTTTGTVTAGASSNQIRLRTVSNASPIADTFSGNTEQSYIDFLETTSTNDPGYIMHETRDPAENNEGVIHLCPSDDNADGDYVSIHGTNDADTLKLHTSGKIEGVTTLVATTLDISGNVDVDGTLETDALTINGTASIAYTSTKDNKLDGIASGATANTGTVDTSGSPVDNDFAKFTDANTIEGRSASEMRSDLNVENGADVTDASNVTSAGALMDSECTNLAAVKGINQALTTSSDVQFAAVTQSSFVMDGNTISGIDDSGEFTNNDSHIMTSAAVEDKILGYGYTTNTGDITGVTVTAGTGLTGGGTANSGAYSKTLNVIGGDGITANANDIAITAAQTTITSVKNTSLVIGRDADNGIHFSTDNAIKVEVNGVQDEFRFVAGGEFHADADIVAFSSTTASDKNLKENVEALPYGLDDVMKMRAVEFDWKKDKANGKERGHDIGVIAQEMEEVIPEVVKEYEGLQGKDNFKAVDYSKLVPVLIKSIQELKAEIEELKK